MGYIAPAVITTGMLVKSKVDFSKTDKKLGKTEKPHGGSGSVQKSLKV